MKWTECHGGIPIKGWCENPEESAMAQARNLSNLPFAFHHVALMPDCHTGFGMPIGGVLATKGVVIPFAIGLDIGCGMHAIKTNIKEIDPDTLKKIYNSILMDIPVGYHHHEKPCDDSLMPWRPYHDHVEEVCAAEYQSAKHQMGTLGGSNHFIELQKDTTGNIWIMIHSGSRNLGKKVCEHYHKIAIELNERWFSSVPTDWKLAFLPLDSEEGHAYWSEMQFCLKFANTSRQMMGFAVSRIMEEFVPGCQRTAVYDVHHNYAEIENHYGKNVIIHRKGATKAYDGDICIIPGSQGTKSYMGFGKGNLESFMSCSHGAGRAMSRTKAKEMLDLEAEVKQMDDQGIIHGMKTRDDLDEAAGSYKSIDEVMLAQEDLVQVITELKPVLVVKDHEKRERR